MTDIKKGLRGTLRDVRRYLTSRAFCITMLSLSLAAVIIYITAETKTVYIRDGGEVTLHYTLKKEPEKILDETGITTMAYDVVDFSGFQGKMGVIEIERAFPIQVTVDGITHERMTTEMTVSDFLKKEGITLGEHDQINISPALFLAPNDHLSIQRVVYKTTTITEEIPFETEYKSNCLIAPGRTRVVEQGQAGKRALTYADRVVDGKLVERQLVEDVVVRQPVKQVVLQGSNKPVSSLDFGYPMDANGKPIGYKKVLTNQIATGYSGSKTAYGASMMNLSAGYVAVRANDIPYGTKMYIASADNSFVYGYAIAADTGIGLMQGVIDVDLFYDSYIESCLNGRKIVNIYILE